MRFRLFLWATALVGALPIARADVVVVTPPSADRWMYQFNSTPGFRSSASVFGAVGETSFDDRDAQFLLGFNTAGGLPTGLNASMYDVVSVSLEITYANGIGAVAYDPTYDSYRTYLDASDPDFVSDSDAGRPLELHGVGFRNGFTHLELTGDAAAPGFFVGTSTVAGSPFSPSPGPARGVRNAFALGFDDLGSAVDVSDNVGDRFESNPFAVGVAAGLTAGDQIPFRTTFTFNVDLSDPDVEAYFQDQLSDGVVALMVSSMLSAPQFGTDIYSFYTAESGDPQAIFGKLTIEANIVPEPSSAALLGLAVLALGPVAYRARQRRRQPPAEGGER